MSLRLTKTDQTDSFQYCTASRYIPPVGRIRDLSLADSAVDYAISPDYPFFVPGRLLADFSYLADCSPIFRTWPTARRPTARRFRLI